MSSAVGPAAAPEDVLVRRENGVLIVTINRPKQRNAVNGAVSAGIARALDLLDSSSELRVGVLCGAGPAFCAGMDLNAFADAYRAEHFGLVNRLVDDGQALTAALELAAQVTANAPMSVRASKAVAIESADWPLTEGFQRQRAYLEPVFASQDAAEGVAAFRQRRDPVWQDR